MTTTNQPIADLLVANESCRRDTELAIKKCINRIIKMREVSPYTELMNSSNKTTVNAANNAEIGRQGAYGLILLVLKGELLNDCSLTDTPYDI